MAAPHPLSTSMINSIKAQQKSPTQNVSNLHEPCGCWCWCCCWWCARVWVWVWEVVRTMCNTRVSIHACAPCNEIKRTSASALALRPETPYACSLRRQVPGIPNGKITQPRGEEKDCEARPPHSPLRRKGGGRNLFHLFGVGCHGSGLLHEDTPGRVFLVSRTLLPSSLPASKECPGATNCRLPPPLPIQGKDHGVKTQRKKVVQCRSFRVPSRSSKAEPLG